MTVAVEHFTAIFGILKWHICIKRSGLWEVLERIRALYSNKDGNSYIRIAFRELHLEKSIQMIVFKKSYRELCSWNNI